MVIKERNNIPKLMNTFSQILDRVASKVGIYLETKLVEKIDSQDPSWAPLKASTIARKGSSKIYIDTGELKSLITHIVEGETLDKTVKVGIFEHDKGLIAHFLEFGTDKGIPERPLFRLTFDVEEDNIQGIVNEALEEELDKLTF